MEPLLPPDTMDDPAVREGIGRSAMVAAKVFEAMAWCYSAGPPDWEMFVPDVESLAHTFSELLSGMVERSSQSVSTGRLPSGPGPRGPHGGPLHQRRHPHS